MPHFGYRAKQPPCLARSGPDSFMRDDELRYRFEYERFKVVSTQGAVVYGLSTLLLF